ncbi:hypothetical protein ACFPK1_32290 [Actinomycetospora rhizophila]|uniref:Uracil-DNA glycosylase-like domain-containing protein n=1 Tax=Actinomycetospora rhizophila TaxID=1416876 RepID=A0ABV9ZR58_9PSEU
MGQLSHVGSHYEADDQQGLRILVVGKQTGRGHEHVTMDSRSAQVASAKPETARPFPRTPHMEGTAAAIKVLLGSDPDADDILGGVHVFDRSALVNATLCSHIPGASAKGQGTPTMYQRCATHLRRTIDILEPTVVIAQGWSSGGWSPSRVVAEALGLPATPARNSDTLIKRPHRPLGFVALVHRR